jgi:hypothetical protein
MIKTRTLLDGNIVKELETPQNLNIVTKCPDKWKIIDMETGQEYVATGKLELYKQWKLVKKN